MAQLFKIKHLKKVLWLGLEVEAFICTGKHNATEKVYSNINEIPKKYDNCYVSYIAYGLSDCVKDKKVILLDAWKKYRVAKKHAKIAITESNKTGKAGR